MNAFCGRGRSVPVSASVTATGRAIASAKTMNAASAAIAPSKPVATMIAPKTKKVSTWKIALTFSEKSEKRSVISCSEMPSVIPRTKAAISPLPKVTSASAERGEPEADGVDALVARR